MGCVTEIIFLAVTVWLMSFMSVQAGLSVHKFKGLCYNNGKSVSSDYMNSATKPIEKEVERGMCMKCFCDKGGSSMTCFGCSSSYVSIEEKVRLAEKRCYVTESKELRTYPMCCKNTVVCDGGVNSKYFNIDRFRQVQAELGPFMDFLRFIGVVSAPSTEYQDIDYFKPQMRGEQKVELLEPAPQIELSDDGEFLQQSQEIQSADNANFVNKSPKLERAPADMFVMPSQLQAEKIINLHFGENEIPKPADQDIVLLHKPTKNLRKQFRNKPEKYLSKTKVGPVSATDKALFKKLHKVKLNQQNPDKLFLKSKPAPKVSFDTSVIDADKALFRKLHKARVHQQNPDKLFLKSKPVPKVSFDTSVIDTEHLQPDFEDTSVDNTQTIRKTSNPYGVKFAPIPKYLTDDETNTDSQGHVKTRFAPIPKFDLDDDERFVMDKKTEQSSKLDSNSYDLDLSNPEVGPSHSLQLDYIDLPLTPMKVSAKRSSMVKLIEDPSSQNTR